MGFEKFNVPKTVMVMLEKWKYIVNTGKIFDTTN